MYSKDLNTKTKTNGESFADKVKTNPDLQVVVYTQPERVYSEEDRLDFIDFIGNAIYELPDNGEMPEFISTVKRDHHLIVTAVNKASHEWLLTTIPKLQIWESVKLLAISAADLPHLRKGLLWLPGRRKLEQEEILKRVAKQNPKLKPISWRIYTRHDENHGVRLFVGIPEPDEEVLKQSQCRLQWSTSRAQYTPLPDVIERKKKRKLAEKDKAAKSKFRKGSRTGEIEVRPNQPEEEVKPINPVKVVQPSKPSKIVKKTNKPKKEVRLIKPEEVQNREEPVESSVPEKVESQSTSVAEGKQDTLKRKPSEDRSPDKSRENVTGEANPHYFKNLLDGVQAKPRSSNDVKMVKKKKLSEAKATDRKITQFLRIERSQSLPHIATKPNDEVLSPSANSIQTDESNPVGTKSQSLENYQLIDIQPPSAESCQSVETQLMDTNDQDTTS